MAQNLPSKSADVSNRVKVDVKREIRRSQPFLRRSFLGAILVGISNRIYEFFLSLVDSEKEVTPLRAVRQLQPWATSYGFSNNPGARARGFIWINASGGGLGQTIPSGRKYIRSDGAEFTQDVDLTLASDSIAVASITKSGSLALVTTSSAHNLSSNAIGTITGANEAGYNLALVEITVTGATTFTYEIDPTTASPATGTIAVDVFGGSVSVTAVEAGRDGNTEANAELSFASAFGSNVETVVGVAADGITSGENDETDEAMRGRLISSIQNPVANYNAAQIDAVAKTVPGVTRVFVQTATPAKGQTTIYFMRDNALNPIPNSFDIANVVEALANIRPAHMAEVGDEIVLAPVAVPVDFVFSALSSDTPSMRQAVADQLEDYFDVVPQVSVDVTEDAYRSAILNTIDSKTGARVLSFTIGTSGDITIAAGEIATLGAVEFP